MLSTLLIENFRCFDRHEIDFERISVIVGANNAGKTTVAEALRLVSIVTSRYKSLSYRSPPAWLDLPKRNLGCQPATDGLESRLETLFHRYGGPPARITATFAPVATVDIYIGPEAQMYATINAVGDGQVKSKSDARRIALPTVSILPQVAPLPRTERMLDRNYVKRAENSHLAHLHFRNQLRLADAEVIAVFKEIVEETWPGLQVLDLNYEHDQRSFRLQVRDRDFVSEVGAMGHGLQMWLQTMWFLARSRRSDTVILDEPDVYMHADLQRRLIRFISDRFNQTILTTHSTEIMSDVDHESIIVVDRRRPRSQHVKSLPGLQSLIDRVGSVHNVNLARLSSSRRFLILEGRDITVLRRIQDTVFPGSLIPFDAIPNMPLPGWGAWNWAVGSHLALKNAANESIRVMCVLDSDYHTPEQIAQRKEDADAKGIWLHIWSRKEIENYLLIPTAIVRVVETGLRGRGTPPTPGEVQKLLNREATKLMDAAFDGFAQEYLSDDKAGGASGANKRARKLIEARLSRSPETEIASGKQLFSRVSDWAQREFGVSVSSVSVAKLARHDELPNELVRVVQEIEDSRSTSQSRRPSR